MLTLESIQWSELTHAYGQANDIPILLKKLSDFPVGAHYQEEPWFSLWSALYHQGDVYSASFAAVPFIVAAIEQNPSRASFHFFALPASIEVARMAKSVGIPKSLETDYFRALAKLPGLALPLLKPDCDKTLCQALLAASAAGVGQHGYAELLLEIDIDSIPETLEWFHAR